MSAQEQARHALYWLPNALTVSRILLIPVLVWAIVGMEDAMIGFNIIQHNSLAVTALGIFIYCMISDFFDGYFARKLQLTSNFGRMLDPIADKLLVAASLIAIMVTSMTTSHANPAIIIPSLMIIGRDIFVSGIREHAANSNIILSPTKLAKWKTTFEMIAILIFLFLQSVMYWGLTSEKIGELSPRSKDFYSFLDTLQTAFIATLWLAAILSAYTGFHYFRSAMKGKATG